MPLNAPNIIFLTIDGLRYDRLGCNGYEAAHSPAIDGLCRNGVSFSRYFCHGSPTQFSFPPIFASTYPLDEGGYGKGIKYRAASFVEVLQAAGYWTVGLSSGGALTAASGYDRGFVHFHHLNDVSVPLESVWKNEIAYYRRLFNAGQIALDDLIEKIVPSVKEALQITLKICNERLEEVASQAIASNADFHGADHPRISARIIEELGKLNAAPHPYSQAWIDAKDVHEVCPWLPRPLISRKPLAANIYNYANKALSLLDVTLRYGRRKSMGVKTVFDSIDRYVARADGRKFFIWAHVLDVHDLDYSDSKIEFPPLFSPVFRNVRRMGSRYRGLRRYDYAVTNVDGYIGRLLEHLKERGLDKNTLLVVTADHGLAANWPRPSISHVANFYDEHCHVPLVFYHKDLSARVVEVMVGSVDLSVMLLGLLGLRPPPSFRGMDALAEGARGRPYILMENLGRGPCDLERKSIRLSIRTLDRKYIMDEVGGECQVREVFDLAKDPDELVNLVDSKAELPGIENARLVGMQRCLEVRSQIFPSTFSPDPMIGELSLSDASKEEL
jgi:arylsulfatase A-like enzyme